MLVISKPDVMALSHHHKDNPHSPPPPPLPRHTLENTPTCHQHHSPE